MAELLPVGSYTGHIEGHDLSSLGDKGTPCVVFHVALRDGRDSDKQSVECEGVRKKILMWLTDRALPYTVKNIRSLGYTNTDISGLGMEHEETSGLVGIEVKIGCKHAEDPNGVVRERLSMFPATQSEAKMSEQTLAVFAKLFREEQKKLTIELGGIDDTEDAPEVVHVAKKVVASKPKPAVGKPKSYQTPF